MSMMIESTMAFLYSNPPSSRRILLKKFMLDKIYESCSDENGSFRNSTRKHTTTHTVSDISEGISSKGILLLRQQRS